MTVLSDYRDVPVLRDASFPDDLEAIVDNPANHTLEVVLGLADVSDVVAFTRPQEGLTVAKAAIRLAGRLPKQTPEWFKGHARSFSVAASRLRGIGELSQAEPMFSLAFASLEKLPDDELLEWADHYRRVGFLRIYQGEFRAALANANNSRRHFEFAESKHGIGCALVLRGSAFWNLKRLDHAAGDFRTAQELLDRDLGFIHYYAASINLAMVLIEGAGKENDLEQAVDQLQQVNDLRCYEEGTIPCITVSWAQARLLMKQGQHAPAQGNLVEVCAGWQELNLPLELTTASLDLARCYFEQGLLAELVQLAGEMFPLFARFRHDERAYKALTAFYRATLEGRLKVTLITDARTAVELVKVA